MNTEISVKRIAGNIYQHLQGRQWSII
jgi:hypothetical protein